MTTITDLLNVRGSIAEAIVQAHSALTKIDALLQAAMDEAAMAKQKVAVADKPADVPERDTEGSDPV